MTAPTALTFKVMCTCLADGVPTVAIEGALDAVTIPYVAAIARAVGDCHPPSAVLDLSEVELVEAEGIEVIVAGALRLAAGGGGLTLRARPQLLQRLVRSGRLATSREVDVVGEFTAVSSAVCAPFLDGAPLPDAQAAGIEQEIGREVVHPEEPPPVVDGPSDDDPFGGPCFW